MMIMIRTIFITILITTIATYYCDGDGDDDNDAADCQETARCIAQELSDCPNFSKVFQLS